MRLRRPARPTIPPGSPAAVSGWSHRTITLVGDRTEVDRICADWVRERWQVLTVDAAPPTPTGLPCHVVRVALPPAGWQSAEEILSEA